MPARRLIGPHGEAPVRRLEWPLRLCPGGRSTSTGTCTALPTPGNPTPSYTTSRPPEIVVAKINGHLITDTLTTSSRLAIDSSTMTLIFPFCSFLYF